MKKALIVTLNGYYNYGNRLQNYALQEVLKKFDLNIETVIHRKEPQKLTGKSLFIRLKKLNGKSFSEVLVVFNHKIEILFSSILKSILTRKKYDHNKQNLFDGFTKKYLVQSNFKISENEIPKEILAEYDYFIAGSDQIWNPSYSYNSSISFLQFADDEKRIAYAPSFGVSYIPVEYQDTYSSWLDSIPHLSVRENDGAEIIKKLTGRDIPVLVDPTLLLGKKEWLDIAKKSENKPKQSYLLTYFLGEIPKEYKGIIYNIAKENNLEVVKLGDIKDPRGYVTGPREFIDYINNCSIFCTDSFHGTVFSIILEKPFIVFERKGTATSMFSRIETILKKFDMDSRIYNAAHIKDDYFNVDFSHVKKVLEVERAKSFLFLENALGLKYE